MKRAGWRLYLAMSKREIFARHILDHLKLAAWFDDIHGSVPGGALDHKPELLAHILKVPPKGRLKLSDAERGVLGEIGHRLGRKVLADIATVARPNTILGWCRKLVAHKFDGSGCRGPGTPQIKREVEELIIRRASENRDRGYDRLAGALPIWDTRHLIKRWAMSCAATAYRRRRSASAPAHGPSFGPMWRCWVGLASFLAYGIMLEDEMATTTTEAATDPR